VLRLGRLAEAWIAPPETTELRAMIRLSVVISSQTSDSGAPQTTDAQPAVDSHRSSTKSLAMGDRQPGFIAAHLSPKDVHRLGKQARIGHLPDQMETPM
jgi:hypothetical protein